MNTLAVPVSNQQLLQGSDFFQMGWEALLLPTFEVREELMLIDYFFFHVHARKQSRSEDPFHHINKEHSFWLGGGSPETRAQPGLVTGSFTPGTNTLKCQ